MLNGKNGSFAVNATVSSTIYFSGIFASKDRFLRGIPKKVLHFVEVKNWAAHVLVYYFSILI